MKVLHIVRQFYPSVGGMEEVVLQLCKGLIKRGVHCEILTLNRLFKDGSLLSDLEYVDGIRVSRIAFRGTRRWFRVKHLKEHLNSFDIIHIHGLDGFIEQLSGIESIDAKFVLSTHGGFFHTQFLRPLKQMYFKYLTPQHLRVCDRLVAVSESDFAIFKNVFPERDIKLITNGINYNKFRASDPPQYLGNFIYLGRFDSHKGLFNLLDTFSLLTADLKDRTLYLIGPEWSISSQSLLAYAAKIGIEKHTRIITDASDSLIKDIVKSCGFICSASNYEGLGMSILEGMGAGLVPIVNDIPAFRSFVKEGINGFLVNFQEPRIAANKIKDILALELAQIEKTSTFAKSTAERFGWEESVRKHIDLYNQCVGNGVLM